MSEPWGLARLEALLKGEGAPIAMGDNDYWAVGCIQDLLAGFQSGLSKAKRAWMPDATSTHYGVFGKSMAKAVKVFQEEHKLSIADPKKPRVDQATLTRLLEAAPSDPRVSWCYAKLKLKGGKEIDVYERYVAFVTLFETNGYFLRLNTGKVDKQGLSFGLIQWAQKQERLDDVIEAMIAEDRESVEQLLKPLLPAGTADPIKELQTYLAKPRNGLNQQGQPTDPRFNFVDANWTAKFFKRLGLIQKSQAVQLKVAAAAFKADWTKLKAASPRIKSDRGVAFMLDVANQHGAGKVGGNKGAIPIYEKAVKELGAAATEKEILQKMADISVDNIGKRYGAKSQVTKAAHTRRQWFLEERRFLNDKDFDETAPPPMPLLPDPPPPPPPRLILPLLESPGLHEIIIA